MKNIVFTHVGGRLGNQLYFILHAFISTQRDSNHEQHKYCANDCCKQFNLVDELLKLNVQQYFQCEPNSSADTIFINSFDYLQKVGIHFTLSELHDFITTTILKSDIFNYYLTKFNKTILNNSMCINIRNGDYLQYKRFNCFDRYSYIQKCLNYINVKRTPHKYENLYVISDDNLCNKELYHELFNNKNFKTINYIHSTNLLEELLILSLFKCKIIWNSTFSYWAAFIGNAFYGDNYNITFAPSVFTSNDPTSSHNDPRWTIINTPIIV